MNERLPYEEELSRQLNDLPLPDENVSWEDMKQRLDKDDGDDGGIIPPVFKGCLVYGLLFMLLAIVLFFIARPDKWVSNKKEKNIVSSKEINTRSQKNILNKKEIKDVPTGLVPESEKTVAKTADSVNHNIKKYVYHDSLMIADRKKSEEKSLLKKNYVPKESAELRTQNINRRPNGNKKLHQKNTLKTKSFVPGEIASNEQKIDSSLNTKEIISEKITLDTIDNALPIDTAIKKSPDSALAKKNPNDTNNNTLLKKDSSSKKPIYFAAGIALHQLVPISGQKFVPYNSLGRKGTLADYIPSIYFRMYKDQKWFVQTEFRYGAPQSAKEIVYQQQKIVDSNSNTTSSSSDRLKKTYYHQLPVSFNYFLLPGLSIGTGFTWNRFSSAIIDHEDKITNNATMLDSFKVSTIMHLQSPDSNFVTSYFQALFETQYKWKRFSIGARYSFGLQPYIKFQLPGGQKQEEKNSSLQIFIRYNLWESKKK